jgi:hypothetical protein
MERMYGRSEWTTMRYRAISCVPRALVASFDDLAFRWGFFLGAIPCVPTVSRSHWVRI